MNIRDNYDCDPIITHFSWRDIIYPWKKWAASSK